MNTTSTHYLLKHLYGETEPTETLAIEDALSVNGYLQNAFQSWQTIHGCMQQIQLKPSDKTIQYLLNYSATKKMLMA
jgi:hypothetical protein